jgi:hypothetical protein
MVARKAASACWGHLRPTFQLYQEYDFIKERLKLFPAGFYKAESSLTILMNL